VIHYDSLEVTNIQIKSPPFKLKNHMLWTTCQNFT